MLRPKCMARGAESGLFLRDGECDVISIPACAGQNTGGMRLRYGKKRHAIKKRRAGGPRLRTRVLAALMGGWLEGWMHAFILRGVLGTRGQWLGAVHACSGGTMNRGIRGNGKCVVIRLRPEADDIVYPKATITQCRLA